MPIISPTAISPHRIGGKSWKTYWATLINAWQGAGSDVYISGNHTFLINRTSSCPTSPAAQTDSYTFIEKGHAIRQKGYINGIKIDPYYLGATGGSTWEFKLFFWNGTQFECKASRAFIPVGSGVVTNDTPQSFTFASPVLADEGDMPGLFVPLKNSIHPNNEASARISPAVMQMVGNIAVGEANDFSGTPDSHAIGGGYFLSLSCWGHRPYAVFLGDSIYGGGNGYVYPPDGREWHTDQENAGATDYHTPGGSANGDINLSIPYRLSTRMPEVFRYQNFGKGGSTFATIVAADAQLTRAVLADPKAVFINCGYNDIAASRTPAQVEANLDTIRAAFPAGTLFYLNQVIPWVIANDSKEAAL